MDKPGTESELEDALDWWIALQTAKVDGRSGDPSTVDDQLADACDLVGVDGEAAERLRAILLAGSTLLDTVAGLAAKHEGTDTAAVYQRIALILHSD